MISLYAYAFNHYLCKNRTKIGPIAELDLGSQDPLKIMSSFEFTPKKAMEETAFVWKIHDIIKLHETKGPTNEIESFLFSAGESIHQPSSWSLQLHFTTGNDIGLYLNLRECPESNKSVCAAYSVSANYPKDTEELVPSRTTVNNEYKPTTTYSRWGWEEFLDLDKLKAAAGTPDNAKNTLSIHVKLTIYGEVLSTPVCSEKMLKQNAQNRQSIGFPEWLHNGEHCDCVIQVKDVDSGAYIKKKAHRIILSVQSPVFESMLRPKMSKKGNATGLVTLNDMTPKGMDALLEFIYSAELPDEWKLVPGEMLNAAVKYNLPVLKKHIGERIHTACTPENAVSLFHLSKKHGLPDATKHISQYIKCNLESVLGEK